jgi:Mrp family chromosome partitioning ATPase
VDLYKQPESRFSSPEPVQSPRGSAHRERGYRHVEQEPIIVVDAEEPPSMTTALVERSSRFTPLESAVTAPVSLKVQPKQNAVVIPKVVQMILNDCGDHWYHLARSLQERSMTAGLRTVLVTGSLHGEGYTTIAIAMAVAMAEYTNRKVLLLDADFSSPQIARRLGLTHRLGLEQVILEGLPIDQALVASRRPAMSILPLVDGFEYPGLLANNSRLGAVMENLRSHFDIIIVDGGSVFAGRSPTPMVAGIDAAMIVRNPEKSSENLLDQLDEYLKDKGISSLGVIENGID